MDTVECLRGLLGEASAEMLDFLGREHGEKQRQEDEEMVFVLLPHGLIIVETVPHGNRR